MAENVKSLKLPLIDVSSPDRIWTSKSIRQACLDYGFFYIINHGVDDDMIKLVLDENKRFFSLPLQEKMKLEHNKDHRGYTPMYSETLDTLINSKGDLKESFYIGPLEGIKSQSNQWPSEDVLPSWRVAMESYHKKIMNLGVELLSLIALALNLDEDFFEKVGALQDPTAFLRILHYPGDLPISAYGNYGASAHSDYGLITLLVTDGVRGLQASFGKIIVPTWQEVICHIFKTLIPLLRMLDSGVEQICREKDKQPQVWEDVDHVNGAFVVNIGDLLERWTNCLFRSTLHRVVAVGQERYSLAFFLDPNPDFVVECLESCCNETRPPRFPPIRSGEYLLQRLRSTYSDFKG